MNRVTHNVDRAAKFFHLESWFRLLLLCVLVGVVSGAGALIFDKTLKLVEAFLLTGWLFKIQDKGSGYWALMAVPSAGGALAGALALWLAPEATGHGTDGVIRAFHLNKGVIRARVPLAKGICSIVTIGTGGSAGKEGPIAQIGAGFGSTLATLLKLSVRDRRILMLAGVAGGIGAIFKAPLGGALFAAEVLYREPDFEHDAVIPGVISSVTAYSVFTAVEGYERILDFKNSDGVLLPPLQFPSRVGSTGAELFHYAVLSLLCTLVAFIFVKVLHWVEHSLFRRMPLPPVIKPAMGGFLLGVLALMLVFTVGQMQYPQVLGASRAEHIMSGGYSYLQTVLNSALDTRETNSWVSFKLAGFLALVVITKIIATSLTIGSGGSGGVLFPALFLGGVTGAAYSKFLRALNDAGLLPAYIALPPNARASMILVGMGGVFAACTKTPIASLVMVSEITGSYGLAVPLMMTCASAFVLSRSFTINVAQVAGIADSPAHRGDFLVNVLEDIKVGDAMLDRREPELIRADTPFNKVLQCVRTSTATVFPIVDEQSCLVGVFSLSDIRQIMHEQSVGSLVVAGDLGSTNVVSVTLETNLDEALRLFTQINVDELPVVETPSAENSAKKSKVSAVISRPHGPAGSKRVIGMLSRRDLISAYHRRLHAIQTADDNDNRGSHVFALELAMPDSAEAHLTLEQRLGLEIVAKSPPSDAAHPEPALLDEPVEDTHPAR